jgi:hypothetical protein
MRNEVLKTRDGKIGNVHFASSLFRHTYTPKLSTALYTVRSKDEREPATLHQRWDVIHRYVAIILALKQINTHEILLTAGSNPRQLYDTNNPVWSMFEKPHDTLSQALVPHS